MELALSLSKGRRKCNAACGLFTKSPLFAWHGPDVPGRLAEFRALFLARRDDVGTLRPNAFGEARYLKIPPVVDWRFTWLTYPNAILYHPMQSINPLETVGFFLHNVFYRVIRFNNIR